jgi:photosynthetic reaction center cytochrome c subunit
MKSRTRWSHALFAVAVVALTAGCERPPVDTVQRGYRGLGMVELYNPRTLATQAAHNVAPAPVPAAAPGGPPATAVFKNLQVLNDLSVGELTRIMVAMTEWVSPKEGCTYCHADGDLAADTKYQKVVARRMLQMTRHLNADAKNHIGAVGVTCFTCHRGQPVPAYVWFTDPGPVTALGPAGNRAGQNYPAPQVGLASLPFDPFTPFLDQRNPIRVVSSTALPEGNRQSIKQTEWTYSLMMHMSDALGVNCTFCHNTRSFASWDGSTPQRATAYYGIYTVRDINENYLVPLKNVYPPARLGPEGDAPKANCATCHQGAFKPLYGAPMAKDYPELLQTKAPLAAAPPAPTPADPTQAVAVVTIDLVKFYFATGKADLPADAKATLDTLAKADPAKKVVISGYHDAQGSLAQNQELAKQRAFAVRDQLRLVGVSEQRIVLMKPVQTQGGGGQDNPEARRVEVSLK